MEFVQVLNVLITVLPLIFCAAFVIDVTNAILAAWDNATPRPMSAIAPMQQPKIESTQQSKIDNIESVELVAIPDPWIAPVQPVNAVKPATKPEPKQVLLLLPAPAPKRKPGRPRKNPVATGGKRVRV